MNVEKIVETYLKEHKFDGLYHEDVPCGCLLGDLAPCGAVALACQPGYREDVDEDCECECDGQGTKHWHITSKHQI